MSIFFFFFLSFHHHILDFQLSVEGIDLILTFAVILNEDSSCSTRCHSLLMLLFLSPSSFFSCEYLTLASWSSFPVNLHFRQNSSLSPINLDLFWQHSFSSFWSPKFRLQSVTSRDGLNQQIGGEIHHSVTNITSKKIHKPSISLPYYCKFSGEKDRCFFPGLFPVLVFHLQLLVLELLSDAGTGEESRVEQRYLQIEVTVIVVANWPYWLWWPSRPMSLWSSMTVTKRSHKVYLYTASWRRLSGELFVKFSYIYMYVCNYASRRA